MARHGAWCLGLTLLLAVGSQAGAMEFVVVGEPGNVADPVYHRGNVDYIFEIGKCEITNAQYARFLNAVASRGDPYGLYNPSMRTGLFGGIDRTEKNGVFRYEAKADWARRPVVYISWFDLARMANWYHYGQPHDGVSRLGTTEGTQQQGAYDTRCFPQTYTDDLDYARLPQCRNPGALYWIPSDNEWYKAAYYDPRRIGFRPYWDYAVQCCRPPNNLPPPGDEQSVNYFNGTFSVGKPYFLTEVSSYPKAVSYFGTYDMSGNVWEWIEDWKTMRIDPQRNGRITRGGSALYTEMGLYAANTDPLNPADEAFVFGGRLARAHTTETGQVILPHLEQPSFPWVQGKIERLVWYHPPMKVFLVFTTAGFVAASGLWATVWGLRVLWRRIRRRKGKVQIEPEVAAKKAATESAAEKVAT